MIKVLCVTPRSVTLDINDGGKYNTLFPYILHIAGREIRDNRSVISVFGLNPDTEYEAYAEYSSVNEKCGSAGYSAGLGTPVNIRTAKESATVKVRDFGAYGDGVHDDTAFIQSAIMCCPDFGRVLIQKGIYRHTGLYLKSNIYIEIEDSAKLVLDSDRTCIPHFPARLEMSGEKEQGVTCCKPEEYFLGTWEGEPQPMFNGSVTGINVRNCIIYGEGVIDGGADKENWWKNPKVMNVAYRPRIIFLKGCENVSFQGLRLQNSPAWTVHPFFSNRLGFYNLTINNPWDSPNTDGIDPESCDGVEIAGVHFSLGDDCIAIKSGKIEMGRRYKTPSENIHIYGCLMEDGHGAVTVGSEAAAGVCNLLVERCSFVKTDRGLRVKTRRGRGEDSVMDNIIFRDIDMDGVVTPFVVNSFYYCDSDGKTDYVQNRAALPVDERTPVIKRLVFERIRAVNSHFAAGWFEGLSERPIEEIVLHDIEVGFDENARCGMPAMACNVPECCREGFVLKNVKKTDMVNVTVHK